MTRRSKVALGAVAGILALAVVAVGCRAAESNTILQQGNQLTGISVQGEGKVQAAPDMALLSLGVTVLDETVAGARERAATSLEAMIQTMRDNGIDERDIQTRHLQISPEYDYRNGQQLLRGYRVHNMVDVRVRNIDTTSQVVDDAVTAGGDNAQVLGIAFTIDDPEELHTQARELAVRDAREKADTLAGAAGVSLGAPTAIIEGGGGIPVDRLRAPAAMEFAQDGASTPIQPGELDIVISVTVTWSIN
jgi:uncharacterized protein